MNKSFWMIVQYISTLNLYWHDTTTTLLYQVGILFFISGGGFNAPTGDMN